MRFDRFGYHEFRDTYRKRLAFARKQLKERERYPLFADQISAEQIDVDTEMAQRQAAWNKQHAEDRSHRAQKWREGRARLAAYPDGERKELLAYWQRCRWPGDPTYLLSMLHMYANGRLDLYPPVVRETEACRKAVNEAIERILERAAARKSAKPMGIHQPA